MLFINFLPRRSPPHFFFYLPLPDPRCPLGDCPNDKDRPSHLMTGTDLTTESPGGNFIIFTEFQANTNIAYIQVTKQVIL